MVQHFIPRPSRFELVLTLLPGMRISDGGPIDLKYQQEDGTTISVTVGLEPRFFRVFYIIAMASIEDEVRKISEPYRGYRSTHALRELYPKSADEVAEVEVELVYRYIKAIRDAVKQALVDVERKYGVSRGIGVNPIQHTRGLGYRVGDISIRILDYR